MMRTISACILLALISTISSSDIVFQDNGYSEVVVAISPDIPQEDGPAIIDGIKTWISVGSRKLFSATKKLAYIKQTKILLPKSWTNIEDNVENSNDIAYEDGAFFVESANPCYLDAPYTIHTGGCGDRGEAIHVTPNYLKNIAGSSALFYGPPENIFVHEWAKFRYGVFEEYGYPGDEVYPLFRFESRYDSSLGQVVTEVKPNFCTNVEIEGHKEDFVVGGPCSYDDEGEENTGLPDENCIFIPDGDNSEILSSLMAVPFLKEAERFCESGETNVPHDKYLPNKHNALCESRSTWDVIRNNPDLIDVDAWTGEGTPSTEFILIQPQEAQFVMVLDVSGSMGEDPKPTRLERLKQATKRWIKYDIRDGSYLGITSFSTDTEEEYPMKEVNDATREEASKVIDSLRAEQFTCLGAGVKQGLETLHKTTPSGGVMVFLTDGEFQCPADEATDTTTLNDTELIQMIIDSKVRIVTIAFSDEADQDLENLAKLSNGKTYFVSDDSGIEDINDALQGCLTYQPSVPTKDLEIVILNEIYEKFENQEGEFVIDKTVGKAVKLQLDYTNKGPIENIVITDPSGSQSSHQVVEDDTKVFILELGDLEVGNYTYTIETTGEAEYGIITVTSKARENQLPIRTKCWANAEDDVDLTSTALVISAQVMQGNKPVMNAKVEAQIEKENQPLALRLDLFDNGSGADRIANDGVYSRYFAKYEQGEGRYMIKCQVKGTDETDINGGFINSRKQSKLYPGPEWENPTPPCCGSNTVTKDTIREPTGNFLRQAVGGSFKIVILSFTSPGDDYDEGKPFTYDVRFATIVSDVVDDFESAWTLNSSWIQDGFDLNPVTAGEKKTIKFVLDQTVFGGEPLIHFAVRAEDEAGNVGSVSNVASVLTEEYDEEPEKPPPPAGLSGGEIAGIVIGSVLGLFLIIALVYFVLVKTGKVENVFKRLVH